MTVRGALTTSVLALLTVAVAAAVALVILTSRLHLTTARLGTAMENVLLAEEALLDLRAIDAMSSRGLGDGGDDLREAIVDRADALRGRLGDLAHGTESRAGQEILALCRDAAERYLELVSASAGGGASGAPGEADVARAFVATRRAIRHFLEFNLERAHDARDAAARWDATANVWGFGAAGVLVLGTTAVLLLLRAGLFRPMMDVASSIGRYGRGEPSVRVPAAGPEELREIARSFNDLTDRLERQRQEQLAFLAGVAHDLRNPLSAIRLACRRTGRGVDPDMHERLGRIERQVGKLDRLAGDFMDAARAEAGRLELAIEPHDVRRAARAVVDLFAGTSEAHRLELVEADEPLVARCDLARIEQVLNNLVGNAIKYSPHGGRIRVASRREGGEAVVSVEDQGIGIAPEDLTRIFEPFRRGSRLTEVVPGLGLGLATSRRIAERHGGTLSASSACGGGSTFELRIPLLGTGDRAAGEGTPPGRHGTLRS